MGIQTKGIPEMQQNLQRLSDQVREKLVLRAVRDGANVIRDAMRESAHVLAAKNPGSDSLSPGQLRGDIRVRAKVDDDGIARAIIGPVKYEYVARWVEFGHRLVKGGYSKADGKGGWRGAGSQIGEVPAYPALRPAFERTQAEAFDKFKGSMQTYFPEALR
jgi:HK97 gp10 family phage protein